MQTTESTESEWFYRYEDRDYSVANEDGDHDHTCYSVGLVKYPVLRRTPKGAWIAIDYFWSRLPSEWKFENFKPESRRFVNLTCHKKFALPTIELALASYIARKERQARIYRARAQRADYHITIAEGLLQKELIGQPKSSS